MIPRFIADEMNGDIARWLRIIGFDCIYIVGDDLDEKLLEIAEREERILLTADRELYQQAIRKNIDALYTSGKDLVEKLRKIFLELNLKQYISKIQYRCPVCNSILIKMKSDLLDLPSNVKEKNRIVYYCPQCKKAYWKGSHWKNIRNVYRELGIEI